MSIATETEPDLGPGERLFTPELFWRDHFDWLKESGYLLRPRFRPGWIPSWKVDPRKNRIRCEDSWAALSSVIDAVSITSNSNVALKKINKHINPYEVEIATFLTTLKPGPTNHCVPILDVLHPPDDKSIAIIVMPLLRAYDEPNFDTIGEGVEFFRQIFEGLQFMHSNHVAHRDCNANNIMMDGGPLFPRGFHPDIHHHKRTPSGLSNARHYTRTQRPIKYYFTDFGLTRRYGPEETSPLEEVIEGGDRTVPEFEEIFMCDPFPTDIYYLGNMIKREFLDGFPEIYKPGRHGFEFMRPLVEKMMKPDPAKRPPIDVVISEFNTIVNLKKILNPDEIQDPEEIQNLKKAPLQLRSRVIGHKEYPYIPTRFVGHWYRRIRSIILSRPALPTPSY
ncbi:hypothetical protein C8J57DRAFT_1499628 [Mycena rebaudengoi]|nr:hypothetical protein C8J57DRAFT_1499628 [Mycena rebaudengoi]